MLCIEINGEDVCCFYFICKVLYENELWVVIKKIEFGVFFYWVVVNLKLGFVLEVMNLMGNFCIQFDQEVEKIYVFFVVGSGIMLIIVIVKVIFVCEINFNVILVFGNCGFVSIIF